MVYEKIETIKGFSLTKKKVVQFINDVYRKFDIDIVIKNGKYIALEINDFNKKMSYKIGVKVFQPVCCSESNMYIVGKVVRTNPRIYVKCNDCKKHTCCGKCIGQTADGLFDVDFIKNNLTAIDITKACEWCYLTNDAGACCNCVDRFGKNHRKIHDELFEKIEDIDIVSTSIVEIFLRLDDCTSCS